MDILGRCCRIFKLYDVGSRQNLDLGFFESLWTCVMPPPPKPQNPSWWERGLVEVHGYSSYLPRRTHYSHQILTKIRQHLTCNQEG
ncbi:hypothetical protein ACLOJK_007225 [Asimina triloba]